MRRASYSPDSFPAAASNVIDFPGAVLAFQRNAKGGMNLFAVEKEFRRCLLASNLYFCDGEVIGPRRISILRGDEENGIPLFCRLFQESFRDVFLECRAVGFPRIWKARVQIPLVKLTDGFLRTGADLLCRCSGRARLQTDTEGE